MIFEIKTNILAMTIQNAINIAKNMMSVQQTLLFIGLFDIGFTF